ncbi:MAG: hypothetical protein J1E63_06015 [Muribaculaceae bacterium]|nr:hypothetical protein [Muribaculaceae bacterium]
MDYNKNFLARTYWQLILVFAVVFLLGMYRNSKAMDGQAENSLPEKLVPEIVSEDSSFIPDLVFGSDEKWEEATKDTDDKTLFLIGEGNIGSDSVTAKCRYNVVEGTMSGRYRHENGTTLDLNGMVLSGGNELIINLGHKSNKTFSTMTLHPVESETAKGRYVFKGQWGKSHKPIKITFTVK